MSFGSFLSGIYHAITPWHDSGSVFSGSSYQPQKKKPDDFNYQPSITSQPSQPQIPTPQRPANIFDTLNKNLVFNKPQTAVPVVNNQNSQPAQVPKPGMVVRPTVKTPEDHINDGLNAGKSWEQISSETNIPLDAVRSYSQRTRPNYGINSSAPTPHIPFLKRVVNDVGNVGSGAAGTTLGVLRAGEGLVQGAADLPKLAVHALTYVPRKLVGDETSFGRDLNAVNRGTDLVTKKVTSPLSWLSRKTDEAALGFGPASRAVYKPAQVATNIATIVPGAIEASSALASKLSGAEDLAKSEGALGVLGKAKNFVDAQRTSPILTKLDSLLGGNLSKTPVIKKLIAASENAGPAASEVGNVLSEADLKDLTTTRVPVGTDVPVQGAEDAGQSIRVRNRNEPKPLIKELAGDATSTTPNALIKHEADQARLRAAEIANRTVPDSRIEGVTPRSNPNAAFKLDPAEIEKAQNKVVQEYADTLRSQGEGNGTQLVPDGEGGYKRVSNNVRSAENKGKQMSKAAWRDEAQRQLEAGKAEPGHQGAFNDAANPDVQSQLAQGERPNVPEGRPITVKQATGIAVRDETKVPQNLPETPGRVRVTESTAPANAKSEAVAAQTPVVPETKAPVVDTKAPVAPTEAAPAAVTETLPKPNESDEQFLRRQAQDMQSNIQRAVDSLKVTKKMTKAERAQRAAAGQTAYEEAKAAGKSITEQEAARKAAYGGAFDRMEYKGAPIHSADEQRLRDMVDEHYKDMPYQAGNVREAFSKLFHAGEPGWQSEAGNHIIPSDIKNIRKFLNESVPNPDGNGGLGDFADSALKELADTETGPGRIAKAIGLQRALRFTADISATGRQALPGALSHPVEFAKAAAKSFEVMFSHEKYQKYASELANSKEANYINDRLGAHLSVLSDPINQQDDIYRNSEWASKIPGVKQVVGASERQYNTILTEMRRLSGQRFIDAAGGIGNLEKVASDSGDAEGFLKAIGTVTNVNTGRGFGKALDTGASKVLSDLLVSPRGLAARIQRFNPQYYYNLAKTNPAAAKEALRSLGIQTALTLSALKAASAAGIYEDGQIKVGNTRYDITGGAANMVRTAVRVAQFMHGDRATTSFNSAPDEVIRWARNQVSPFLASALDTIGIHPDPKTGEYVNSFGDKVTPGSEILNNITPVNASQVNSDLQLQTPPGQTAINAALNTLGVGVNSYQSAADKKAGAGPSNSAGVDKSKFGQATDSASFRAQAPAEGYNLQKLDDGSYAYSINGEPHKVGTLKEAQQAIARDSLENSDQSYKIIGDKVYRKKEDGTVGKPISKTAFDYQLDAATLISKKKAGDLAGWTKTANKQIDRIEKQLQDPNTDPVDAQKLRNDEQTLVDDMAKYKKYGGFTKGAGGGGRGSDTSFGQLKAGAFAPSVQQYDTIATKSGAIPHIGIQRPNIVHQITSSGGIR